jgi:hypothetical protein
MLLLYELQALCWLWHDTGAAIWLQTQQVLLPSVPAVELGALQHPGSVTAAAVGGQLARLQVGEGWVIKPNLVLTAAGRERFLCCTGCDL